MSQRKSVIPAVLNMSEDCKTITSNRLLESIGDLSDELEFFGLLPLPKYRSLEDSSGLDQCKLAYLLTAIINAGFDLMQHHRIIVQEHNEAEEKQQRLIDDCTTFRTTVERLKADIKEKERLLSQTSEQEWKLKVKCDKAIHDLKKEQDEVRRLKLQMHHESTQTAHALRRKEQEVMRLEDQLRGRKPHPKPQTPNEAKASNKAQEKEELYKRVIKKFEVNSQTLIKENLSLHSSLYKMNTNLGQLVAEYNKLLYITCDEKPDIPKTEEKNLKMGNCTTRMHYEPSVKDCSALVHSHIEQLHTVLELLRSRLTGIKTNCDTSAFPLDPTREIKQEVET